MLLPFPAEREREILHRDGIVRYFSETYPSETCQRMFSLLTEQVAWEHDLVRMFGKEFITGRMVAWYGDRPFEYAYSGHSRKALPWIPLLDSVRKKAQELSRCDFDACLLNLYHHGGEGMGWHSDDEDVLDPEAPISSFSFGAARKFAFKHKLDKTSVSLLLEDGSMLLMDALSQRHWLHALPKSKRITEPRINLTFRKMR